MRRDIANKKIYSMIIGK